MAEWDTAYINDLPDSAFAVILPGGEKDDEGKTTPRDLRKLPHHNAAGDLDMPHLRNGLSREPQADMPAAMHTRAHAHLMSHAEAEGMQTRADDPALPDEGEPVIEPPAEAVSTEIPEGDVQVRSASRRELDIRIMPWNTQINTLRGPEEFARGAFAGTDPKSVFLMGMDHEAHIGLDQNGQPALRRRPVGRGLSLEERDDAAYMTFKVANTAAGDEVLALAADGIVTGASVETLDIPGGHVFVTRGSRRVRVYQRVALTGVSTTYRPAFKAAGIVAMRSEGDPGMTETLEAPVSGAEDKITEAIEKAFERIEARSAAFQSVQEKFLERLEGVEEQARASFEIPNPGPETPKMSKGDWLKLVVSLIGGERLPQAQMRALDDITTTDNPGVVPPTYLKEMIGVIDASRPFLGSTRRLEEPATMKLTVPVITQRPLAAVQSSEKSEVESRKTLITSTDFEAITIAGAGDLSIQIIKKSTPAFLDLWMELLGEAYAIEAEDQAIQALFNAIGGVGAGTALNPEDLNLGAAFVSSFDAIRRPPDTIWLSTQAVGEFIDAKASTTNQPLYPGLTASATAAGGITGVISGLRPVHVPTLDAHGAYAIVGPSSGFAWAESGTYTLQADNPTLAGRDIALVGLLYPAPWYPAAFTAYNVAS